MQGTISIEVAPGELLDKLTILDIKLARLDDENKLRNVATERGVLGGAFAVLAADARIAGLHQDLRAVNEALWCIEDEIRACERRGDFGPGFIELARSVYKRNDERAAIKRRINLALGSRLVEEKSYAAHG